MFNKVRNYFEEAEREKIILAQFEAKEVFYQTELFRSLNLNAKINKELYDSLREKSPERAEIYFDKWVKSEAKITEECQKFQANYVIQDKKMRELEGKIDMRYYAILIGLTIGSFIVNKK